MADPSISSRKDDHIQINLEKDVTFDQLTPGFERYRLQHCALPEIDLENVDTRLNFLGRPLALPLIIASMTGGTPLAGEINQKLAEAAQAFGLGMGLGSMRALLAAPETLPTFQMRRFAPQILLLANLGAVQLNYGYGPDDCQKIVEMVEADGLILHLNPLQEALQPEGNTRFSDLLHKIEAVCRTLSVPVIVKEVGWGISASVARQLIEAGVSILDVAGAGGTSWSQVEMYRSPDPIGQEVAATFRNWGLPTTEALRQLHEAFPALPLIASGGLHNGLQLAIALALGAQVGSLAGPLLRAAAQSPQALADRIEILRRELRIAMFCAGVPDLNTLHQLPVLSSDH